MPKIEFIMGKMIEVEIVECSKYSMMGKIVSDLDELAKIPSKPIKKEILSLKKVKSK